MGKIPVFANQVTLCSLSCARATYGLGHGFARWGIPKTKMTWTLCLSNAGSTGVVFLAICSRVGDLFSLEIFICHRTNVPCALAVAADWEKEGVEREREVEGGLRWGRADRRESLMTRS
jgi:hypothetical protein